jgi:polysaccharide export outer membrane protein
MNGQSLAWRAAACAGALIFAAAVCSGQDAVPVASAIPVAPAVPAGPQPSGSYRMQPKDSVHISVFGEGDLDTTARIDKDGNIFFPLLGQAKIGGETVQEATETMTTLLKKYLINPQVSVEITGYVKQHFTILGQVNKPGIYDIPDESSLNLLEALGMAGGYTKIANPAKIIIKRYVNGQETVTKVNGKELLNPNKASEPVFQVQPGDTINVGEAIF